MDGEPVPTSSSPEWKWNEEMQEFKEGWAGWRGRMKGQDGGDEYASDETQEGERPVDWEGFEERFCCRANCR